MNKLLSYEQLETGKPYVYMTVDGPSFGVIPLEWIRPNEERSILRVVGRGYDWLVSFDYYTQKYMGGVKCFAPAEQQWTVTKSNIKALKFFASMATKERVTKVHCGESGYVLHHDKASPDEMVWMYEHLEHEINEEGKVSSSKLVWAMESYWKVARPEYEVKIELR